MLEKARQRIDRRRAAVRADLSKIAQADAIAALLCELPIVRILSSSADRCVETVTPLAEAVFDLLMDEGMVLDAEIAHLGFIRVGDKTLPEGS